MRGFWKMAWEAAEEAQLLLAAGKARGAASRAYYALFDAARAALAAVDPELTKAKTHKTIIARFGAHIVQARGFNSTEDTRIAADYDQKEFEIDEARAAVERMKQFLAAVAEILGEAPP